LGKDAAFFAFLSRQEGEERKRREELKFLQKELDYNARLDKKVCPSCGAVQSYDEVRMWFCCCKRIFYLEFEYSVSSKHCKIACQCFYMKYWCRSERNASSVRGVKLHMLPLSVGVR
jgi:hypothetical protein